MKNLPRIMRSAIIPLVGGIAFGQAAPEKKLPFPSEVFQVAGHTAFVIPSTAPSAGKVKPWVWYAPTLPNLPGAEERWMFGKFREAGIAIAGIDVGESYGSPAGRALFSQLHAEMAERRGYSRKPVLLGLWQGFFQCGELVTFVITHAKP